MKEYPEIIESTTYRLPFLLVLRDIILTALCWLLFIYFVRDALTFFSDVWDYMANGFANADKYASFSIVDTIVTYGKIILITNAVYALWAIYNKLRFSGKTRRRNAPPVTSEEIASRFKLNQRDIESWQKTQSLVMHHDKE